LCKIEYYWWINIDEPEYYKVRIEDDKGCFDNGLYITADSYSSVWYKCKSFYMAPDAYESFKKHKGMHHITDEIEKLKFELCTGFNS
jgi:hypothetical protein